MRGWVLLFLTLVATGPMGCSRPIEYAIGSNQELSLFTPWNRDDDRVEWARDLLQSDVVTAIRPEKLFKAQVVAPEGVESRKNWRIHVFLDDLSRPGRIRKIASSILSEASFTALVSQGAGHTIVRDAWARGQTTLFLHCAEAGAFRDYLKANGERILEEVESALARGLSETVYAMGEQAALREGIEERHGFSVRIPAGFKVAEDSTQHVLRIYNVSEAGQAQFLILHSRPFESAVPADPDWGLKFRDALVGEYNEGDRVELSRSSGRTGRFQGRQALLLKGLWQNDQYDMGGAFETIFFGEAGRLVMIDLAVFYPSGDKLPFLRELRGMASTFRMTPGGAESS